jgi:predicted transcriptional regulator
MNTIWKPIKSTNGKYEASNKGEIRNARTQKVLKTFINVNGYMTLTLRPEPNKQINARVHKLVTEAFLGDANGLYVNHKDGNKLNNNISNLEYVTASVNNQHALDNGLRHTANMKEIAVRGEQHYNSRITEDIVFQILDIYYSEKIGCRKIAKRLNISHGTVDSILVGKSWKDSVKKYKELKNIC